MGKVKWSIDADEPEDLEGYDVYDGPDLPKGVYRFQLKFLRLKENRNGDPMLNGLLVVNDDRADKKRYNGAPVWFNQNVTEQGKPYVKQFLNSIGVSWKDFMSKTVMDEDTDPPTITKMGVTKLDGSTLLRALIKIQSGEYSGPQVANFLPPRDEDDDDTGDSDDGDDDGDEDGEGKPF